MIKEPTLSDAIYALGIDGGWKIREGKIVKWWAEKEQPTEEAIQAKLKELEKQYADNEYQRKRLEEYNAIGIGEQLDMIYPERS